MVGQTSMAV